MLKNIHIYIYAVEEGHIYIYGQRIQKRVSLRRQSLHSEKEMMVVWTKKVNLEVEIVGRLEFIIRR